MSLQPPDVVTTQRTAKRFKAVMLVGILGLLASPSFAVYGMYRVENTDASFRLAQVSIWSAVGSLVVYLLGAGMAWWYHE